MLLGSGVLLPGWAKRAKGLEEAREGSVSPAVGTLPGVGNGDRVCVDLVVTLGTGNVGPLSRKTGTAVPIRPGVGENVPFGTADVTTLSPSA